MPPLRSSLAILTLSPLFALSALPAQSDATAQRFRADSLFWRGLSQDSGRTTSRNIQDLQASLRGFDFRDGFQREYLRYISAQLGQLDIAFAQVDTLLQQGWLDLNNTFNFAGDNAAMLRDPRWAALERRVLDMQQTRLEAMAPSTFGLDAERVRARVEQRLSDTRRSISELIASLRAGDLYDAPRKRGAWMLCSTRIASVGSPAQDLQFFVWVPSDYRADRPHPAVLWSHQGWYYRPVPVLWTQQPNRFDNPFWQFEATRDFVQIVPLMSRALDGSTPLGQLALREVLVHTKHLLNLDDDRVLIAGHSNGGSAAFRAIAESTSPFAGALTLNGWPDPGIAMRNWGNRTVASWSGEQDALFAAAEVTTLQRWAAPLAPTWAVTVVPRADHGTRWWLPDQWPAIEQAARAMRRDPFGSARVVQSVDGRTTIDWLSLDRVDTTRARAAWHQRLETPVVKTAGDGGRGSPAGSRVQDDGAGVIRGRYADNTYTLETSRVASASLLISPEMVDLSRPVIVLVNGVERYRAMVTPDARLLRAQMLQAFDRRALWVARISVEVPTTP